MEPVYKYITNEYQVWDTCKTRNIDYVEVSEIWVHNHNHAKVARRQRIRNENISSWMCQNAAKINGFESSILLRFVWVKFQHTERTCYISPVVLRLLQKHFHIDTACQWNGTCFAGATAFPAVQSELGLVHSYAVCNHPKVAIAWSYSPSKCLTQGIYFAGSDLIPQLEDLLESLTEVAHHPMLAALIFGMSLSNLVEQELKVIKESVRQVEVRTRFHSWTTRTESPAPGSYFTLSSQMVGAKTRLANLSRRTKVLTELCDFIEENQDIESDDMSSGDNTFQLLETITSVKRCTHILKRRIALQEADVCLSQQRADSQFIALSNLRAQEHAAITLEIARTSLLDSLSLKTLALVTMFFLPGTLIASIFTLPVLNWEDSQSGKNMKAVGSKFWVYWAFTIPVTIATFITWGVWTSYLQRFAKEKAKVITEEV